MTIDMKAIPSLYDITGDIKDINTMLVPKQLLEAAEKALAEPAVEPDSSIKVWVLVDKDGNPQKWRTPCFVGPESDTQLECFNRAQPDRAPHKSVMLAAPPPPADPAVEPPNPSPTAGMNMAQRILHVGGRNNAAGYVEFGSIQAVEALVRQVLRDLPPAEPAAAPVPPSDESIFNAWVSDCDSDGIAYDGPSFEQGYLLGRVEGDTAPPTTSRASGGASGVA